MTTPSQPVTERLAEIEARLDGAVYSDYGPDPTADLRYLLNVARAAEALVPAVDGVVHYFGDDAPWDELECANNDLRAVLRGEQ